MKEDKHNVIFAMTIIIMSLYLFFIRTFLRFRPPVVRFIEWFHQMQNDTILFWSILGDLIGRQNTGFSVNLFSFDHFFIKESFISWLHVTLVSVCGFAAC